MRRTLSDAELLGPSRFERGATSESRCEEVEALHARWLEQLERELEAGDARRVLARLGAWVASDARPLGVRGGQLVVSAARAIGREDVARAHAFDDARASSASSRREEALVVGEGGAWFQVQGRTCSLERRPSLRRMLAALVDRPEGLEAHELFAAVWSERRTPRSVVHNRVDVSLARLRALGLRAHLVRCEGRVVLRGAVRRASERPPEPGGDA